MRDRIASTAASTWPLSPLCSSSMPYARSTICMPGRQRRRLERDIGELVDRDPGRDLDEQRSFFLERHEAGAHGLQEAGELRLQRIEDGERAKLHESI